MDMLDSSTSPISCNKMLERNPPCIFNIYYQKKLLKQWTLSLSGLKLFGRTVRFLCNTLFITPKHSFDFPWML